MSEKKEAWDAAYSALYDARVEANPDEGGQARLKWTAGVIDGYVAGLRRAAEVAREHVCSEYDCACQWTIEAAILDEVDSFGGYWQASDIEAGNPHPPPPAATSTEVSGE